MEERIFSSDDFSYNEEAHRGPAVKDMLLHKLAEWLFGDTDWDALRKTRSIAVWMVVIIGLLIAIRLLSRSAVSKLVQENSLQKPFSLQDVTEDMQEADFESRIRAAMAAGDYRLAIRCQYLWVLSELHHRGNIVFAPSKTNFDYCQELEGSGLRNEFRSLSRIYDHVWYGKFMMQPEIYLATGDLFLNFRNKLYDETK